MGKLPAKDARRTAADDTDRPHQEAEDKGDRQRQLNLISEEHQRVDDGQQRNDDMLGDPPVELDGSVLGEGLSTPQIRRRRGSGSFPKATLETTWRRS